MLYLTMLLFDIVVSQSTASNEQPGLEHPG